MAHKHTNHLIHETSPYLLQHAHNPVEWHPWGEEAFAKAKAENKPVLLSIGYSACHWCHVMEHESFENEEIAARMNEYFVNIKVDREERPDLDEIYMHAVQMLTGRGGWPLTVFLTSEGKPFYGGTYFPPQDRFNLPGFPRILLAVAHAYRDKPEEIEQAVQQILGGLHRLGHYQESRRPLSPEMIANAATRLAQQVDRTHGGLGGAPKFPNAMVFSLFLRCYRATKNETYLEMVTHTLRKMAEGGMYDQIGGGFHRYSVDERWLVPHFEKMLYDNALLSRLYLEAYQITRNPFFRRVVEETLAYVMREMLHPHGGFYSAQDADSEGVEGKFFIWSKNEVIAILGPDAGEIVCRYYDITDVGNFEGKNILHVTLALDQLARLFKREVEEVSSLLSHAKGTLFQAREGRIKPLRDEKILTSWNGLMLSSFIEAHKVLGDPRYLRVATDTVGCIMENLCHEGHLLHSYKDGQGKFTAYLDDYAFLTAALIDLYEATFASSYVDRAIELTDTLIEKFWDENGGGFFFTGRDHESLISRMKPAFDGSIPSGNSVAAHNLLRLFHYTDRQEYLERGEKIFRLFGDAMEQNPFGFSNMLCALDFYLSKPKEIVLVGTRETEQTRDMLAHIHSLYLPNKTLFFFDPTASPSVKIPSIVEGKGQVNGKLTAYVCHNFVCSPPVTAWDELQTLLLA